MDESTINVRRAALEINKILQELERVTGRFVVDVGMRREALQRIGERTSTEVQSVEIILNAPSPIRRWE